jgi:phthiocerol/phenolphthiocerol synthesis type-I polyketide synthase E
MKTNYLEQDTISSINGASLNNILTPSVAEKLACPACRGELTVVEGPSFSCTHCPRIFPASPVPVFLDKSFASEEKKENYQTHYTRVDHALTQAGTAPYASFLNYGYAPTNKPRRSTMEPAKYAFNRNSIRLLYEIIGEIPLQGMDVLDVGCGRGGNVATVAEQFSPGTIIGIDLCVASIAHCARVHDQGWFCAGDAENLPFRDTAFDVVLNVESSHCYPNINRFFDDVKRVLRQDGHFLYGDIFPVGSISSHKDYLQAIGFELLREDDITQNVVLSCDQIAPQRKQAYAGFENKDIDKLISTFIAAPGSSTYETLKSGAERFITMAFKKVRD